MMSSCTTLRLKRRSAFSKVSPSWICTSATGISLLSMVHTTDRRGRFYQPPSYEWAAPRLRVFSTGTFDLVRLITSARAQTPRFRSADWWRWRMRLARYDQLCLDIEVLYARSVSPSRSPALWRGPVLRAHL